MPLWSRHNPRFLWCPISAAMTTTIRVHPCAFCEGLLAQIHDWIRLHCEFDVCYDYLNMDYKYTNPQWEPHEWRKPRFCEVKHGYHGFWFRTQEEATYFLMQFANWCTVEANKRHPCFMHIQQEHFSAPDITQTHSSSSMSSHIARITNLNKLP
jgi:hypothetical protein